VAGPEPDEAAMSASGAAAAQLVEVVDTEGRVLEVTTRSALRAGNLRHRCTYVAVVDDHERVVVHQRADWKDVYPSYWDVCFGGVCGVGEPWLAAAARELAEEAGINGVELEELGPVSYDEPDGRIVGRVYLARYAGLLSCPDGEVVATDRVPAGDLASWLAGRAVCPDSAQLVVPMLLGRLNIG
jgi:8-oxo-dGTP pyrophosphatase MutT (NUDIX family)